MEFDDANHVDEFTEPSFEQVNQTLEPGLESTCNDLRNISGSLSWTKAAPNLFPVRICRHRDEKGSSSKMASKSKTVCSFLACPSSRAEETCWKVNMEGGVVVAVRICIMELLGSSAVYVIEGFFLHSRIHITHVLVSQPAEVTKAILT